MLDSKYYWLSLDEAQVYFYFFVLNMLLIGLVNVFKRFYIWKFSLFIYYVYIIIFKIGNW